MTGKEYQELAIRTNNFDATEKLRVKSVRYDKFGDIVNGCFGLAGETGELLDLIKKVIFHDKPFDKEHVKKELGDVMWYISLICHGLGFDLDEVMRLNIEKLKARYPEGFSVKASNNRAEGDV